MSTLLDHSPVAAMMKHRLITSSTQEFDAFEIWGRLLNDPVVFAKASEMGDQRFKQTGRYGHPGTAEVLEKLTREEIVALRERVAGVVPIRA